MPAECKRHCRHAHKESQREPPPFWYLPHRHQHIGEQCRPHSNQHVLLQHVRHQKCIECDACNAAEELGAVEGGGRELDEAGDGEEEEAEKEGEGEYVEHKAIHEKEERELECEDSKNRKREKGCKSRPVLSK